MKKLAIILILIILSTSLASATVIEKGSGIFAGSMRNIVVFNEPYIIVEGVGPGDFISFQLPDKQYLSASNYEKTSFYLQRIDSDKIIYDWGLDKFKTMQLEKVVEFDLEGTPIFIELLSKDFKTAKFKVYLEPEEEEATYRVLKGEEAKQALAEQQASKEVVEEETTETIVKPKVVEPVQQTEEVTPEIVEPENENKGFFGFLKWLFSLF